METGVYIIDALLKEPSVGLFDEQIKLRLELSIEVVLKVVSVHIPKHLGLYTHFTYRILGSISGELGCIILDDLLWKTIGCCCFSKKL